MSENPIINMLPKHRFTDYCDGCQQLGEKQVSGVKRHRSMPLDTWLVELSCSEFEDTRETVLCSNCIDSASKEEFMNLKTNEDYKPFYVDKVVDEIVDKFIDKVNKS